MRFKCARRGWRPCSVAGVDRPSRIADGHIIPMQISAVCVYVGRIVFQSAAIAVCLFARAVGIDVFASVASLRVRPPQVHNKTFSHTHSQNRNRASMLHIRLRSICILFIYHIAGTEHNAASSSCTSSSSSSCVVMAFEPLSESARLLNLNLAD